MRAEHYKLGAAVCAAGRIRIELFSFSLSLFLSLSLSLDHYLSFKIVYVIYSTMCFRYMFAKLRPVVCGPAARGDAFTCWDSSIVAVCQYL